MAVRRIVTMASTDAAIGDNLLFDDSEAQWDDITNSAYDPGGTSSLWHITTPTLFDQTSSKDTTSESAQTQSVGRSIFAAIATVQPGNNETSQRAWNVSSSVLLADTTYDSLNGSDEAAIQFFDGEMHFSDIMGIWVTGIFCLLGIAGNILSFMVLVRAFGKSPMFFVLRAIAVSDALFLAIVFIMQTLVNMYPFTGIFKLCYMYRGYIQWSLWPPLMMTQMSTVWLTILVSIERYIAICFPLHSAYLLSLKRVKRAVAIVFIVSILYNIPRYFENEVIREDYRFLQKSEIGYNAYFRFIYMCTLYSLVLFLLPLILLIILNLKLVLALQQGKRQWQKLQSRQKREQTLTIIPLTIVLVFFICGTPALVVNIIESSKPTINDINFIRFLVVANLLVVLNSACNFIIYCMLGKRFRTKLLELCRCSEKKKHSYQVVQQLVTSKITDV